MNLKSAFCLSAAMCATFGFSQVPVTKLNQIMAPNAISYSTNMGPVTTTKLMHFTLTMPPARPAAMQSYADAVSNPASPYFRMFLTPQQVATSFGQPLSTVQSIANYLTSQGLTVNNISPSLFTMKVSGTVGQVEAAFGTTLYQFHSTKAVDADRPYFYSFTSSPQVPTSIAPYILDVAGLQNYSRVKKRVLTPNMARVLYGTAPEYSLSFQGQGRSVAISSFDGFLLNNVPLYFAKYALPGPPTITVKTINGGSGSGPAGGEGDLDIQMVLGMAPRCHFYIYDGGVGAGGNDLLDVLSQEESDNLADVISESYGWLLAPTEAQAAHQIHLGMTLQGQTYMAASGDSGTQLEPFAYPDYDPEVLLVGGTVATTDPSGVRTKEVTWSLFGAGGGGWTDDNVPFNIRPPWQKGTGVPTNVNHRLGPDVALMGGFTPDGLGAYYFFFAGALHGDFAGTSFASPVFAGQLASTEQRVIANGGLTPTHRVGRIQDLFYGQNGKSTEWFDIVSGGSTGILPDGTSAIPHPGWDYTTGWGAINWQNQTLEKIRAIPLGPSFVGVVEGTNLGFPTSNVSAKDGQYFEIAPISIPSLGQAGSAAFSFTLPATSGRADVSSLEFIIAGEFAAGSTGQIYLLNYTTGKWDILKSFAMNATGASLDVSLNSSFTTYMSAAGQYQILVRGLQPISAGVTTNSFNIDYVASNALVSS